MKKFNYIYKITNNINNKVYIGKHSTNNLEDGYFGSGKLLKLAINKYGIENFEKEIIAFCCTEEELNRQECFYIRDFNSTNRKVGYNLTKGGDGTLGLPSPNKGKVGTMKGKTHSEETKQKIGKSNKGKTKGRVAWNKGISHSEETRQKISESKKGKTKGRTPWNKGMKMTEEYRQKLKGRTPWNKGLKYFQN